METCPECGERIEYIDASPTRHDEPGNVAGWQCLFCDWWSEDRPEDRDYETD